MRGSRLVKPNVRRPQTTVDSCKNLPVTAGQPETLPPVKTDRDRRRWKTLQFVKDDRDREWRAGHHHSSKPTVAMKYIIVAERYHTVIPFDAMTQFYELSNCENRISLLKMIKRNNLHFLHEFIHVRDYVYSHLAIWIRLMIVRNWRDSTKVSTNDSPNLICSLPM